MQRDRPTGYVNSGNFDTVVENKIGARIHFPEAIRILLTCYIKGRKALRSHLSIIRNTKTIDSASSSNDNESHVSVSNESPDLLYRFDVDDPWKYFCDGVPVESSVERGRKKTNPKHKRIYISKQKKTFTARKNRAQRHIRHNTHSQLKWAIGVQEIGKNKVSPNKFRMFLSKTNGSQGQNTKKISI